MGWIKEKGLYLPDSTSYAQSVNEFSDGTLDTLYISVGYYSSSMDNDVYYFWSMIKKYKGASEAYRIDTRTWGRNYSGQENRRLNAFVGWPAGGGIYSASQPAGSWVNIQAIGFYNPDTGIYHYICAVNGCPTSIATTTNGTIEDGVGKLTISAPPGGIQGIISHLIIDDKLPPWIESPAASKWAKFGEGLFPSLDGVSPIGIDLHWAMEEGLIDPSQFLHFYTFEELDENGYVIDYGRNPQPLALYGNAQLIDEAHEVKPKFIFLDIPEPVVVKIYNPSNETLSGVVKLIISSPPVPYKYLQNGSLQAKFTKDQGGSQVLQHTAIVEDRQAVVFVEVDDVPPGLSEIYMQYTDTPMMVSPINFFKPNPLSDDSNLEVEYILNQLSGTTIVDTSPNHRDITLANGNGQWINDTLPIPETDPSISTYRIPTESAAITVTRPVLSLSSDDYAEIPKVVEHSFTVSAWFAPTAVPSVSTWYQGQGIVAAEMPGDVDDWGLVVRRSDNDLVNIGVGNPDVHTIWGIVQLNHWNHAVVVIDRDYKPGYDLIKLYVNGRLVQEVSRSHANDFTSPEIIGLGKNDGTSGGTNGLFSGKLANIVIFSRPLTDQEARWLYLMRKELPVVTWIETKQTVTVPSNISASLDEGFSASL